MQCSTFQDMAVVMRLNQDDEEYEKSFHEAVRTHKTPVSAK